MSLQWEVTRCILCSSQLDSGGFCCNEDCLLVYAQNIGYELHQALAPGLCVVSVSSGESTVIDTNDSVVRHNNTPALEITRSTAEPSVVVVNTTCENMWEYLLHSGFLFESGFPHTCDDAENMVLGYHRSEKEGRREKACQERKEDRQEEAGGHQRTERLTCLLEDDLQSNLLASN